jgi:hypothetical protein
LRKKRKTSRVLAFSSRKWREKGVGERERIEREREREKEREMQKCCLKKAGNRERDECSKAEWKEKAPFSFRTLKEHFHVSSNFFFFIERKPYKKCSAVGEWEREREKVVSFSCCT